MVPPPWKIVSIATAFTVVAYFGLTCVARSTLYEPSVDITVSTSTDLRAGDDAAIAIGPFSPGPSNFFVCAHQISIEEYSNSLTVSTTSTSELISPLQYDGSLSGSDDVQGNARRIMKRSQSFTASAPAGNTKTNPVAEHPHPKKFFSSLNRKFPWLKTVAPALIGCAIGVTLIWRCYCCSQNHSPTIVPPTRTAKSTTESINLELHINVGSFERVGQGSS